MRYFVMLTELGILNGGVSLMRHHWVLEGDTFPLEEAKSKIQNTIIEARKETNDRVQFNFSGFYYDVNSNDVHDIDNLDEIIDQAMEFQILTWRVMEKKDDGIYYEQ